MKISGFTIIKNAIINDYPIVEAITSILPVVNEMIVLCGDSDDETTGLISAINSPKIKIHNSIWNQALRKGGRVLADETDKAFALVAPESDWAFYIQGDEIMHEKYCDVVIDACKKYKDDKTVEGLLFKYLHFYGTYDYIGDSRRWYNREVRVIRNDKTISAYRDAQGFRKGKTKLPVKLIDAYIYHYGWVKSPVQMRNKMKEVSRYWLENDEDFKKYLQSEEVFNFDDYDSLQKFTGSHPAVILQRVRSRQWDVDIDVTKKHFSLKNRFLYWFERQTGIRPFDFRNYKII